MNVVAANYRAGFPANVDAPSQIEVVPILEDAVGNQRRSYLMLFGAVGSPAHDKLPRDKRPEKAILGLRNEGRLRQETMRIIQRDLDLEEARLT